MTISAKEGLERLREGNRRFVQGQQGTVKNVNHVRLKVSAGRQSPFAIILGCSDSRVPAELVFDQGLGDLFVIRVAGNVANPSNVGSAEFSAQNFGTRLVVVLGHSNCSAVEATIDTIEKGAEVESPNLRSIVDAIRPGVEPLMQTEHRNDRNKLSSAAVKANIQTSVAELKRGPGVLDHLIRTDGLVVIGAEYSLQTSEVEFFEAS